jgi:hypothetical protein
MLPAMLAVALASVVVAAAPVRLLVLELEPLSVEPDVSRAVDAVVLGSLSKMDGVEVISQGEIKKLAEVDAPSSTATRLRAWRSSRAPSVPGSSCSAA